MRSSLVFKYLSHLFDQGRSPNTLRVYLSDLSSMCGHLNGDPHAEWQGMLPGRYKEPPEKMSVDISLKHATAEQVDAWIKQMSGSEAMRRQRIMTARHLFAFLVQTKVIGANPMPAAQGPAVRRRHLNREEVERLLAAVDLTAKGGQRDFLICVMIYRCLLTTAHCVEFRRKHIADDMSRISIPVPRCHRDIDVPEDVRPLLLERVKGMASEDRVFARKHTLVSEAVGDAASRAGLYRVNVEVLRIAGAMRRIHEMCAKIGVTPPKHLLASF